MADATADAQKKETERVDKELATQKEIFLLLQSFNSEARKRILVCVATTCQLRMSDGNAA